MDKRIALSLRLELVWWIFTGLLVVGILYPIYTDFPAFPFFSTNSLFIIVFITLARYIFLLKHTFLAHAQLIKVGIVLCIIPIIFLLINELNYFRTYVDEVGLDELMQGMSLDKQQNLLSYIKTEMRFFGAGAIISAIIFPFRLIISIWRNRNKGTV